MSEKSPGSVRLVATSFFALFSIVGLCLYGLPYYYDFFVRELGWTRAQVTSGNAISKLIVGPAVGFLAGWLVDRLGPKRPMIVGVLLAGVALIGLGGTMSLSAFYFFYLLNALAYLSAGPLPNQVLLSRHFTTGRGRAMGIAYLGIGLGGALVPLLSAALVEAFGWRTAMRILGGIVIAVALPLILLLPRGDRKPATASPGAPVSLRGPLTSVSFYLLLFGSAASIGAVGGANQHLKLLLTLDQARPQELAAKVMSLVLVFSLFGRLAAGALADRIGPRRVMLLVYALVFSAMVLLGMGVEGNLIYLFALIFGLGLGGEYLIIPLVASELFGTVVLGRVLGLILAADGVAEAVFPYLVGVLRDRSGSYNMPFQVLAVAAALGAVAVALLRPPKTPPGPTAPAA